MAETENLQSAREAIAALNAHDLDRYVQHMDSSIVAESETLGEIHGREGVRQAYASMFQAFPDLHWEVEQLLASGDHIIARVVLTGTHEGAFAGIAPTHRKASWRGCSVVEIRHGKAVRARIYADHLSLMRQLGVLPAVKGTTA
jgi:steroid delta-isomerase-like uncharacterized protein